MKKQTHGNIDLLSPSEKKTQNHNRAQTVMDTHNTEKTVDKRKIFTSIETKINVSPRVSISNECVPDGLGNTGRGCVTKENDYSEQEKGGGGRQSTQSKHYRISYKVTGS